MNELWAALSVLDFAALVGVLLYLVVRIDQELKKEHEG